VAVVETTCPFCAVVLGESFRGQPRPTPPPRRLSRAAMVAAGATLIGACSANDAIGNKPGTDAAIDRPVAHDSHFIPLPAYGISVQPGTGGTFGTGGSVGAGGATDAGNDGPARDAAHDAAHDAAKDRSVIAIYGAAFAPGGTDEKPQG
jgi:hypothetical protein